MTKDTIRSNPLLEGGAERRDMDHVRLAGSRKRRRRLIVGAAAGGAALLAASTAWACTLRIGTLQVCRGTGASQTDCASVTGSGGQGADLTDVDNDGSTITVTATNFLPNVPYSITFRKPTNTTGNCHRPTADASIVSLLGTDPTTGLPNTVTANGSGHFTSTPNTPNTGTSTGAAKLCVQDTNIATDTPDLSVVTGNVINMNVALL